MQISDGYPIQASVHLMEIWRDGRQAKSIGLFLLSLPRVTWLPGWASEQVITLPVGLFIA